MRNGLAIVALCATTVLTACAVQTPVGPSEDASATSAPIQPASTLTVRVLARDSEQPIAGAAVQSAKINALTDERGVCILPIAFGEELEVNVSAPGYEPMIAAGAINANERWTFYLQSRR